MALKHMASDELAPMHMKIPIHTILYNGCIL
jgi:hypothetical protein